MMLTARGHLAVCRRRADMRARTRWPWGPASLPYGLNGLRVARFRKNVRSFGTQRLRCSDETRAVQWAIALPSGSGLSRDLSDPSCNPLLTCAQSRGRKPNKNRAPATAAPKKRLDNFNNTPQVSPLSTQPAQEPPPATAPRQEQPTSKLKPIAMTLWRWLRSR